MRILLVLPAVDRVRVTPDAPRVPRRSMKRFSVLPLTTVAALTPPHHEVTLCDENVEALDLRADVDLVAVSFMTAYAPRAYEIAAAFRARGVVTVAGGYHPTFLPDEAGRHFDAVVVGEAEGSWPRLLADPDAARRLFTAMAPMGKRWVGQCSIEIADDEELLRLARRAGCLGLFVGVETLSAANLHAVGKGFNERDPGPRIARIRAAGIGVIAGIIVGMDDDDAGTFERLLRFLDETSIDAIQVNIMTPLPGTPLYEQMDRAGRVLDRDWSRYDFRHCVIRPARMTAAELQDGADWLYAQFYRLDRTLARFARALATVGPAQAWLGLRLALTYRYDNRREGIRGRNPARGRRPPIRGLAGLLHPGRRTRPRRYSKASRQSEPAGSERSIRVT